MRYQDLSNGKTLMEDLGDLEVDMVSKKRAPDQTQIKKQGLFKRILKKMTAATFLGLIGLAGGPIGAALGVGIGAWFAGRKNKKVKVKGQPLEVFMKEQGIDKQLSEVFNKYFSDAAMKQFTDIGYEIAQAYANEKTIKKDMTGRGERSDVLRNTRDYQLQDVRHHLNSAGEEIATIAREHNLKSTSVTYMFEVMYGDGPLNYFMKKTIGSTGLF